VGSNPTPSAIPHPSGAPVPGSDMKISKTLIRLAPVGVALISAAAAGADFPQKAVRIVVPFAPGGGTDNVARALAQKLNEAWKQPVIIDNRGGGGSTIGTDMVARAAPDGHTIGLITSTFAVNASLYQKLPYDSIRDFAPVTQLTTGIYILVVHPSLPVKSVSQLIDIARARPDSLFFSSPGNGGAPHLAGELLKTQARIRMVHVPYKGAGPAMVDLIAGHVQLMFSSAVTALPHIRSGRLRALAVTTTRRFASVPELPTMAEAGLPGYEVDGWYGILAPAQTPPQRVRQLSEQFVAALRGPDIRDRFAAEGFEAVGTTPEQFSRHISTEIGKWARVIAAAGVKADQ
jgi:tripartite-type tricarboxylate transporter receptor subunit TctC